MYHFTGNWRGHSNSRGFELAAAGTNRYTKRQRINTRNLYFFILKRGLYFSKCLFLKEKLKRFFLGGIFCVKFVPSENIQSFFLVLSELVFIYLSLYICEYIYYITGNAALTIWQFFKRKGFKYFHLVRSQFYFHNKDDVINW